MELHKGENDFINMKYGYMWQLQNDDVFSYSAIGDGQISVNAPNNEYNISVATFGNALLYAFHIIFLYDSQFQNFFYLLLVLYSADSSAALSNCSKSMLLILPHIFSACLKTVSNAFLACFGG